MSRTAKPATVSDSTPPRRAVPTVMDRADRVARKLKVLARKRTGQPRLKPSVFIVGAQKAGTSSLFNYLMQHPNIGEPIEKEVHYFDVSYGRGDRWYEAHFPSAAETRALGADAVTIDASPYYMFHPAVAGRLRAYAPDAKIIILLREPVDRAWSHYWHEWNKGYEPLPPMEALDAEVRRVPQPHTSIGATREARYNHHHLAYVARSEYVPQLQRWQAHFPEKNILTLKSEDLFTAPQGVVDATTDFIGLPRLQNGRFRAENVGAYEGLPDEVRDRLAERLEETKAGVRAMLGDAFVWN